MLGDFSLLEMAIRIPVLLLALSVHELAHGYTAYKLGDSTAKLDGRLSLNPIRHIDPIGLICMLIFRFGWAKPVMVDYRHFEDPKKDMAITAVAGPISNFIFAFVSLLILVPVLQLASSNIFLDFFKMFLLECFRLNVALGVFNLIPIPPLDGSKFFGVLLPDALYSRIIHSGQVSFVILMLLVWTGVLSKVLNPMIDGLLRGMLFLVSKIYFFL